MRVFRLDGGEVRRVRVAADGRTLTAVVAVFPAAVAVRPYDLAADAALAAGPRFPDHPVLACGSAAFTRWAGPFPPFPSAVAVVDAGGRTAVFRPPEDGYSSELTALALSANGKWAFAGLTYHDAGGFRQRQGVVYWNAGKALAANPGEAGLFFADLTPRRVKVPGDAAVTALAVASDGKHLAVGTEAGEVYVRALPSREAVAEFEIPFGLPSQRAVRGVEIVGDLLLAWTETGAAAWDLASHDPAWRYAPGHAVAAAAVSLDGSAAVAGEDEGLILLDARGGVRSRIAVPIGDVLSVGFAPDGLTVACGGENGAVAIVDAE